MRRDYCDRCSTLVPTSDLRVVQTCPQTHSSPAEFASWCGGCRGVEDEPADPDGECFRGGEAAAFEAEQMAAARRLK